MSTAVGYLRVSTEEQGQRGLSPDAQRFLIREACAARDLPLPLPPFSDEESGSVAASERPGLTAALAELDAGRADTLVVVRLDRLSRDALDALEVCSRYFQPTKRTPARFRLVSLREMVDTTTAAGRKSLRDYFSQAQYEREVIAERTSEALQALQRSGVHVGAVPFGWRRVDRRLVRDDAEQSILELVRGWVGEGGSASSVAAELNARGVLTARGGQWSERQVRRVLERLRASSPPAPASPG